jgi:K+ transporter
MRPNMVDWSWVGANIDKLIIPVRTYSQSWVDKEIKDFTGALFVYSMWEGYREEQGFQDTLEYFKSRGMPEFKIHASGHAYFSTIRKLVDNKKPRLILPVHTERPENFVWAFGDRVKILNNGGSLEI